jgi:hypothetical protein
LGGGPLAGRVACGCLLPPWIPQGVRACNLALCSWFFNFRLKTDTFQPIVLVGEYHHHRDGFEKEYY